MSDKIYTVDYLKKLQLIMQKTKQRSYELIEPSGNDIIIDAGCGAGMDVVAMSTNGASVYGLDVDPSMIDFCIKNSPGIDKDNFIIGSAEHIPFPDNSVNKIRFERVFQHVGNHDEILNEAKRVLKDDGKLLIIDTDYSSISLFLENVGLEKKIIDRLVNALPGSDKIRQLPDALRKKGFKIDCIEIHNYIFSDFDLANSIIRIDNVVRYLLSLDMITTADFDFWANHIKRKSEFNMSLNIMLILASNDLAG